MKNFTFFSLDVFPFICKFFYYLLSFVFIIRTLLFQGGGVEVNLTLQRLTSSKLVIRHFLLLINK